MQDGLHLSRSPADCIGGTPPLPSPPPLSTQLPFAHLCTAAAEPSVADLDALEEEDEPQPSPEAGAGEEPQAAQQQGGDDVPPPPPPPADEAGGPNDQVQIAGE